MRQYTRRHVTSAENATQAGSTSATVVIAMEQYALNVMEASNMRKEVIYNLLEQLGGEEVSSHTVLMELIQWLDADTIEQFVEDFKQLNDIED